MLATMTPAGGDRGTGCRSRRIAHIVVGMPWSRRRAAVPLPPKYQQARRQLPTCPGTEWEFPELRSPRADRHGQAAAARSIAGPEEAPGSAFGRPGVRG
ncbi:MAG: hypothetical protein MZW92_52040 [Comamonadaceae bacterium]|nr:hypothetical protein [Comamonadaceae bacterium]